MRLMGSLPPTPRRDDFLGMLGVSEGVSEGVSDGNGNGNGITVDPPNYLPFWSALFIAWP
ncbi:predicted protein [Sclerotinia sclerotiorum 1980 UF-70]|uniref:Uncharacterized protein n=1 Tax=Sclerotinia sclerotiorum (strain ATCC 18683 / 1980 / Ss-1) TaxID=665079 RepID=A7EVS4_SCLS1|nr:predicted protein [Sclerotinia sclerotiorum 1980 UF-70]EDN93566.1 predicted protein [Sclerotinia sclerotiorum 1980 UF-70]